MKALTYLLTTTVLAACSSLPRSAIDINHIGDEKVILSSGKDDSLKDADPFRLEGHRYVSTAFVTITDGRPEVALKLAQISARSLIGKTVDARLESYLQQSSEATAGDVLQLRELITESSKLDTSEWIPGHTYYEKIRVIGDSGIPRVEVRAWAEISIDERLFKQEVLTAIRSHQGKDKGSAVFANAVDNNFKKLIGDDSSTILRMPAKIDPN